MFQFLAGISTTEYILLGLILLVLVGPKLVRMMGRTGGSTYREIKKIKHEFNNVLTDEEKESDKK